MKRRDWELRLEIPLRDMSDTGAISISRQLIAGIRKDFGHALAEGWLPVPELGTDLEAVVTDEDEAEGGNETVNKP
jgi:hypothetical protein